MEFEQPVINTQCQYRTSMLKWELFLYSRQLPWEVRETLIDLYPSLHRHFMQHVFQTKRKNLYNMNQLAIELCKSINDYEQYVSKFIDLKTQSKRNNVKRFIQSYIATFPQGTFLQPRFDFQQEFIEPVCNRQFNDNVYRNVIYEKN